VVAGYVHHVVHAAQQPERAPLVYLATVTGEVFAFVLGSGLPHEAVRVAVNCTAHGRPGPREHQITFGALADPVPSLIRTPSHANYRACPAVDRERKGVPLRPRVPLRT